MTKGYYQLFAFFRSEEPSDLAQNGGSLINNMGVYEIWK